MRPQPATFSAFLINALLDFASSRGADTAKLTENLSLDTDLLKNEDARVPVNQVNELWNIISETINDHNLGLHFGEALGTQGEGHFLFTIMKNCETLHEAIALLTRYHRLMTDLIMPYHHIQGDRAVIKLETGSNMLQITRHISESVLSLLATILKRITNSELKIREVHFTHTAPADMTEYEKIFSIEPVFGSTNNQLVFSTAALDRTFPLAHKEFKLYLRHYADMLDSRIFDPSGFNGKVSLFIKKSILNGEDYSLMRVAKTFELSQRQIQNKLKSEGTTYQVLLEGVRKDIAVHLLKNKDIMLIDIAFTLGYEEQSSFNHAFKKWTGETPKSFREKL